MLNFHLSAGHEIFSDKKLLQWVYKHDQQAIPLQHLPYCIRSSLILEMPIDIDDPNTLTPYNFNCFQPILQLIHDIAKTQLLLSFRDRQF